MTSRAFARSGGQCWFCGSAPCEEEEHLIPQGQPHNGTNAPDNLVGTCIACNQKKAGQRIKGGPPGGYNWTLEEFRTVIAWRLKRPSDTLRFYGEQFEGHRAAQALGTLAPPPHAVCVPGPDHDEAKGYIRCPTLPEGRGGPPASARIPIDWSRM